MGGWKVLREMEAVVCLAGVKVGMTSSCTSSDQVGGGSTSSVLEPNWLPPGFRFHPTDDELVSYYLAKKVVDSSFAVNAIAEVDLNKCEPWDLPGMYFCRSWPTCCCCC